jgi:hypothetical protein
MAIEYLSSNRVRTLDTFGPVVAGDFLGKTSINTGAFDGVVDVIRIQTATPGVKFSFNLFDKQTSVEGDINNIVRVQKADTTLQLADLQAVYVNEDAPQEKVLWFDFENTGNIDSGIITVKLYITQKPQPIGQAGELLIPRR